MCKKNTERIYWILQYCSVFYHLLLMLRSQLTSAYFLHILYSHFYVLGNEEMIFLKQFWGWLTSSITSVMGNQVSLQIFVWLIDGSQRIIDLLFEEQYIYGSQKTWWGKGGIPATLFLLWETLWPMSKKVDVMKIFQSIMIWYMNLLTLSYPLQYAKRLVTQLQGKRGCVNSRMSH